MDSNWGYVALGYMVTAGALGAYCTHLGLRLRRARRLDAGRPAEGSAPACGAPE